ncbi:MAG: HlyD family efflux transporter periplasmic adaptor subunit [Woeseia sp.]
MSEPLIRPEVLEAARHSWLGGISLVQPLPIWLLTGFAFLSATAIVLFLVSGEYTRRSRVVGQLVPDLGLATVVAPVAGVVAMPMPDEGRRVIPGQPLVVISTPRATTDSGDTTAGLLVELQRRRAGLMQSFDSQSDLLELQKAGFAQQLKTARTELAQIDSAIEIEQERVGIAGETLAHFRKLAVNKYATRLQLAQQEQASLEQVASLQALRRQATAVRRNVEHIEQTLQELPAQQSAQTAARMRELAELDQERLQIQASGEVLVQAPVAGLVASRLIERGQTVQAGQPLLSLLPSGSQLQAQLLVPSRAVGFIEPGDSVDLRYPAFPHQKFGHHRGTVLRISRNALSPQGLGTLIGNVQAGEPYYRVLVDLSAQSILAYGKPESLRPGMLVEADILGERRKLYEWVLEPVYALTGRL